MHRTLATTVALVLAVTAGGLTAPAFAAAEAAAPLSVPAGSARSGLALYRGTGDRTAPLAAEQFIASVGTDDQLSCPLPRRPLPRPLP